MASRRTPPQILASLRTAAISRPSHTQNSCPCYFDTASQLRGYPYFVVQQRSINKYIYFFYRTMYMCVCVCVRVRARCNTSQWSTAYVPGGRVHETDRELGR
jgi:hypothetical protein